MLSNPTTEAPTPSNYGIRGVGCEGRGGGVVLVGLKDHNLFKVRIEFKTVKSVYE